ncbi:MAG: hypothetical protein U5P41_12745 [Gammaproteobacteria bacterium]|nr:hypothetical protein [Gammaproteobacteria bacterium]
MNQEYFYTDTQDSWNCIVAYIYPEKDRRNLAKLMKQLKKRAGVSESNEVKLKEALNICIQYEFLLTVGRPKGLGTTLSDSRWSE